MRKLILRGLFVALFVSSCVVMDTRAQKSRRSISPRRATSAARGATSARATAAEITEARASLAEQVKLLSRFLYLYGRISGTIELNEQNGGADSGAQSRAALVANFRNVRAGLDDLAERFSRTPSLASQSLRVTAASDLAGQAEANIAAGRLDEAGRVLVSVVTGLTDVLVTIR